MEKLCRTCITRLEDQKSSISLFSSTRFGDTVAKLLVQYCLLEISEQDTLPKNLCMVCMENLLTVVSFRKTCEQSEQTLRQTLEVEKHSTNLTCLESLIESKSFEYFETKNELELQRQEETIETVEFETETIQSMQRTEDCEYADQTLYNVVEMMSLRCCVCAATFHNQEEYREHVAMTHDLFLENKSDFISPFVCSMCKHTFSTSDELKTHQGKIFMELFQCHNCDEIFDTVENVTRHFEKTHSTKKNVSDCPEIISCISMKTTMHQQTKNKKSNLRYCCVTHCHDCFNSEAELIIHAQQNHALKLKYNQEKNPSKPHLCSVCFRTFDSLKNLKVHQFVRASNEQNKHFACTQCTFRAVSRNLLAIHERSKHSGERPFECSFCAKRFFSELHLKNHLVCHSSERPFPCTYCEKVFSRKRNMEEHIRSCHSVDKPFQCSLCPARFKVPQHLRIHLRIHSGEKPYKCSFCDNSYYHISDRKRHEMVHTGEKPHICGICEAAFTRKRTLLIHKRTHTGERPFHCPICGKGFCQNATLKKHVERHTNGTTNGEQKLVLLVEVCDDLGEHVKNEVANLQ
ncbi:gastrula zinc finger protein XlCGF26.1-like [Wyeomyia smithii]|uniref:gastrula zinc finger protein XlCGF26.1-like n=1 Tax=Wyeomyia smithii TaxID=174621 RepID=UPI0024680CD9|nr:gastrula zinc finger protein XlCGF26.1-like [Wyeomyia smithii]